MPNRDLFGLPGNSSQPSEVFVKGGNAYGSSGTYISRYTTIVRNTGSDITYIDDAVKGASCRINRSGWYHLRAGLILTANAGTIVGISVNCSEADTAVSLDSVTTGYSLTGPLMLTSTTSTPFVGMTYLYAGDIVRPHYGGTLPTNTGNSPYINFHICSVR